MIIDPRNLSARDRYQWMIASIVPRPIGWVSTVSRSGVTNLAPFSYFNGVSSTPPVVSVAIGKRKGGVTKDTLRNIEETKELVVNLCSEDLAKAMVVSSGEWPPERSEFEVTGLTPVPSDLIKPPRVGESPLSMECRAVQLVPVGPDLTTIVLAEVLRIHVRDDALTDGLPDSRKMRPLARLGGELYARLGEILEIPRPR